MEPRQFEVPDTADGLEYLGHYGGYDLYGQGDAAVLMGLTHPGSQPRTFGVVRKSQLDIVAPHRLAAYREAFRRLALPKKCRPYAEVVAMDLEDWK